MVQSPWWRLGESSDSEKEKRESISSDSQTPQLHLLANGWRIVAWEQKSVITSQRRRPLFREVLDLVISDSRERKRVRKSIHEDMLLDIATGKRKFPDKNFSIQANDRHPALSVVDIDRDGLDDLYVMARFGRNMLFRNRGDGTFEEIAAQLGLDIEDHCSSAIFADFDNDGDADLFLGRTLRPSMYLVNEDGKFVDRSKEFVATALPYLVYSISAADYNNDGLLDVFFATAAEGLVVDEKQEDTQNEMTLREFLSPEQAREIYRQRKNHRTLERIGPPNVLLVNRGNGRFELAPENEQVAVWHNTNQGTWSDFDGDGDQDLYLSNDFAVNTMLRNDGEAGFVDVTSETGTADIGYGMGVSFGDYDNDGRQDLYVTNMYSKAGQRITRRIKGLDPRFGKMARGNSLFRNLGNRFEKVSGLKPPKLLVEKAGWSWDGQFVDFDNDGYLDIYALNGYYTAPKEVALPVDW